jgi:hypothetical protein
LTARLHGPAKVFETSLSTRPYLIVAAIIAVYMFGEGRHSKPAPSGAKASKWRKTAVCEGM